MLKNKNCFSPGDLVAVFGAEDGKEGKESTKVSICVVVSVGKEDLIIEEKLATAYSSRRPYYIVPQAICVKIKKDPAEVIKAKKVMPQVGDLVLSYVREAFKSEKPDKITGILYKITYKFGKPCTSTLLCGTEMKEVPFSSLMVLERN